MLNARFGTVHELSPVIDLPCRLGLELGLGLGLGLGLALSQVLIGSMEVTPHIESGLGGLRGLRDLGLGLFP